MAESEHVVAKNNMDKSSIFNLFSKLLASESNPKKTCILLFDALQWDDRNVGKTGAPSYVSKRLVRGMASSQIKRQSVLFSSLAAALQNEILTPEVILSALDAEVKSNGLSKSEQGVVSTITVMTCGAIIQSGTFSKLASEVQLNLLKKLVVFGSQKQYLRNATSAFFVELLQNVSKSTFKVSVWPVVQEYISSTQTLPDESYALLFLSAWRFPKVTESYVVERFTSKNKLCEEAIPRCAYYPLTVQNEMLDLLLQSLIKVPKDLLRFWKLTLGQEHKMTPKWSYFLLNFCNKILNFIESPSLIANVLKPEIVTIFLLSSKVQTQKSDGNDFQALCKSTLEIVVKRLTADNVDKKLSLQTVKLLLLKGDLNFDKMTKTRTVHLLLENLNEDCVKLLLQELRDILNGISIKSDVSGNKVEWSSREKQFFLSMFNALLSHSALQKDVALNLDHIKFLFEAGFLKTSKMKGDLKRHAKDTFFKAIELRNFKMDAAVLLLNDLIVYINKSLDLVSNELSETTREEWKNVLNANKTFMNNHNDNYASVRLLLLHMGLLLFRDPELASSTIKELLQCYNRIQSDKKNQKSKNASDAEEPHWMEVTVDLLLALLSRENKILRHVVNSVFPSMTPHLTPTALQQIVDALDPEGRNGVLKHVDSDNSDDDDDGDEDDSSDGEGMEDSDDSAIEDEELEHETVNDKLKMAVRNALGYSATMTDDESVDMDDMDEDEEKRLNDSLANAFRMFRPSKGSKKKQSKDDEALSHFRSRVLDLVEIIATTNPALATCLDLLSPLLALLELAVKDRHLRPLQNRTESVLKKLSAVKKFENVKHVKNENVVELHKGMFQRDASGLIYAEMASVLTECASLLVRASQVIQHDSKELEDCYINLLDRFFKNNDRKVPFNVFPSVLRMLWDGNWKIAKHIMILLLDKDLKLFKKIRLLNLLEVFYRNDRLQSTATDDRKTALCSAESKFISKFSKMLVDYNQQISKTKMIISFYLQLLQIIELAVSTLNKYRNVCPTVPKWKVVVEKLMECPELFQQQRSRAKLVKVAQICGIPVSATPKRMDVAKASNGQEENLITKGGKRKRKLQPLEVHEVKQNVGNSVGRSDRKRKVSEDGPIQTAEETSIKKKKKHSNKQSRELRETASSYGIDDSISFSSVSIKNILDEDEEDPITTVSHRRKKTV